MEIIKLIIACSVLKDMVPAGVMVIVCGMALSVFGEVFISIYVNAAIESIKWTNKDYGLL